MSREWLDKFRIVTLLMSTTSQGCTWCRDQWLRLKMVEMALDKKTQAWDIRSIGFTTSSSIRGQFITTMLIKIRNRVSSLTSTSISRFASAQFRPMTGKCSLQEEQRTLLRVVTMHMSWEIAFLYSCQTCWILVKAIAWQLLGRTSSMQLDRDFTTPPRLVKYTQSRETNGVNNLNSTETGTCLLL